MSRLRAFVLRSKVELADDSSSWRIEGLVAGAADAPAPSTAAQLPAATGAVARLDECLVLRVGDRPARWLSVSPAGTHGERAFAALGAGAPAQLAAARDRERRARGVRGDLGEFVAQMLNLDVLGAIAFDKGCYTGQEVIARAHYRGRVKRRLQRFRTVEPRPLQPGDTGELADGRAFRVVDAVRLADGVASSSPWRRLRPPRRRTRLRRRGLRA